MSEELLEILNCLSTKERLVFEYTLLFFGIRKITKILPTIIERKIDYEIMQNYQLNISQKLEGS